MRVRTTCRHFSIFVLVAMLFAPIAAWADAPHQRRQLPAPAEASTTGCHLNASDLAAKSLAREAEVSAELIATEDNGSYARVSPATIHRTEPRIPVTRQAAARSRMSAYLLSASGTTDSYKVAARAFDGNTYTIVRTNRGQLMRHAVECGRTQSW